VVQYVASDDDDDDDDAVVAVVATVFLLSLLLMLLLLFLLQWCWRIVLLAFLWLVAMAFGQCPVHWHTLRQ
jgi:glucan phosphoethanolaminetransferase (alkaline phosphatase superfamily)